MKKLKHGQMIDINGSYFVAVINYLNFLELTEIHYDRESDVLTFQDKKYRNQDVNEQFTAKQIRFITKQIITANHNYYYGSK